VQGKTSVLFGAISIVVVGAILVGFVLTPQSASQAHTDTLREAVNRASRAHKQVLGLMASPAVKVDGVLPPIYERVKKNDKGEITEEHLDRITVLGGREQNTAIPTRFDELRKELQGAIDKAPQAQDDAKAAAYALMGQILGARAQYYLQSATNAAARAGQAMAVIDSGIISIHERLANLKQNAPLVEKRETIAGQMKTDADAETTRLEGAIDVQTKIIATQETARDGYRDVETRHRNEASELRALSKLAIRDKRRELQEQSFVKDKIANKARQDAEDAQTKIDRADSAKKMLNIELTAANAGSESAAAVLKGFSANREAAKGELDTETLAINEIGKEIAKNVDLLVVACDEVDAAQVTAAGQYTAALEAIKQFQQHVSKSSVEGISSEGGVLMDKAWAAVAVVSWRQSVETISARLKALWETAPLEGDPPKAAEMTAFAGKASTDKASAADDFATAASLYKDASTRADSRFKWSFECRELQARRARHQLTGDADDNARANLLEQHLGEMKGFPYVDDAL
jgi:hypothetical protein